MLDLQVVNISLTPNLPDPRQKKALPNLGGLCLYEAGAISADARARHAHAGEQFPQPLPRARPPL